MDEPLLANVIQYAIGFASADKIVNVIKSYEHPFHHLIGAFVNTKLIGVCGFSEKSCDIVLRHISIIPSFQRKGIGTLLLNTLKESYAHTLLITETDSDSVEFYIKSGFQCHSFTRIHGTLRYKCTYQSS